MPIAIVTGSGGLIGSEAVRHFAALGFDVVGIDNDMRAYFFGPDASTAEISRRLAEEVDGFHHEALDIRDAEGVTGLFARHKRDIAIVIHAAAQPSHDWAAKEPRTDFAVNAVGTLNVLEAVRAHCPDATFVFTSTNKVYGDRPNALPLVEHETRLDLPSTHRWFEGIDEHMAIDRCTHSLFGASKAAADLLVQEYGRYFQMPTVCFRGGCLTGPGHAAAEQHGFLGYLMKCTVTGARYTVFGYGGKQVRDNIHAHDVVQAFSAFHAAPRSAAVYNIGGGRESNVSLLEAIAVCEQITNRALDHVFCEEPRVGDHRWWISDVGAFRRDYPAWHLSYGLHDLLREIHDANVERWTVEAAAR